MSTAPASTVRVTVELPDLWQIERDAEFNKLIESGAAQSSAMMSARERIEQTSGPTLIATLFAPIADDHDELTNVVTASMVIRCVPISMVQPVDDWPVAGTILRDIPIAPGIAADFWELIVPVVADDLGAAALVTFTTPNLPMVSELEPGFRAMAESVRFEVVSMASSPASEVAE